MSVHRVIITLLLLLAASSSTIASCVMVTDGVASMLRENIHLENDSGDVLSLDVLVADDGFERASGFQHVCPEVIDETLILFRYPQAVRGRFHMQNVYAPLDIAFIDALGDVITVLTMDTYTDQHRPLYGPDRPFQYALEARVGFFEAHGISSNASRLKLD